MRSRNSASLRISAISLRISRCFWVAASGALFAQAKLREIALKERADHRFELSFVLESERTVATKLLPEAVPPTALVPDYVSVEVTK